MTKDDTKALPDSQLKRRRITRLQAAAILGRGLDAVAYYHGKQLHPEKDAEGRWLYDRAEVERLAVVLRLRRPRRKTMPKGELHAEVFRCFELGLGFREIVMRLNVEVDELEKLRSVYDADGASRLPTIGDQISLEKKRTELEIEQARLEKMRLAADEKRRRRGDE